MKAICKSCNIDFETGKKNNFTCPSCGRAYNLQAPKNTYSIKFLNGLLDDNLSEQEVKNGILNGKYLSVDYISSDDTPWIKLKSSEFGKLFKATNVIADSNCSKTWLMLFWLSFLVNIILLALIWFQKGQIDNIIK